MNTTSLDLIAYLQRAIAESGVLDHPHDQEHQKDEHDDADEAAWVRTIAVLPHTGTRPTGKGDAEKDHD